jgi:SAM-dependent methyltransferase
VSETSNQQTGKSGAPPVTEEQVQDFWTKHPMVYGPRTSPDQVFAEMERVMRGQFWYAHGPDEPLLARYLGYESLKGRRVLEIGFGTGWLLNEFVRAGAEVHGIDLSRSHEELCRHRFQGKDVRLQIASAENIPYPDNTFDLVAAFGVLHHASDDARCYAEVHRVLKPGGRTFLALYRRHGAKYYYQNIFRKGVLQGGLFRHGFNVDAFIRSVTDKYGDDSPGAPVSRHYTEDDLRRLLGMYSRLDIKVAGARGEFSEIPFSRLPVSDWILSDERRAALLKKHGGFWFIDAYK